MNDKRIWTIGAALLAAALLLGGYFLGVAPQLAVASAADTERAAVEAQNAGLEAELAVLKQDFVSIDTFKEELADLRIAVPNNASFSAFVTELDALAAAAGVQVSALTVADAIPYAGPMNGAALMLPTGALHDLNEAIKTAAVTGDPADAAAADALDKSLKRLIMEPAQSALVTPSNFVAIPVTVEARGEYQRLLDFTSAVQNGKRLTLVYGLALAPKDASAGAEGADEPVADGSPYTATMSGYVYVLLKASDIPAEISAATTPTDPATEPATDTAVGGDAATE